jgi:hypothetical protein
MIKINLEQWYYKGKWGLQGQQEMQIDRQGVHIGQKENRRNLQVL